MSETINITHGPYILNFELKDNVIAVGGFSGTGKSFWFDKLPKLVLSKNLPEIEYCSHLKLFRSLDKEKERYFYFVDNDSRIIIIDNADLFFREYEYRFPEKYRQDIISMLADSKHYYILVGRKLNFTLYPWQCSEFKYNETTKTYYLSYPLIEMGVIV